jgi:hypothetical protein
MKNDYFWDVEPCRYMFFRNVYTLSHGVSSKKTAFLVRHSLLSQIDLVPLSIVCVAFVMYTRLLSINCTKTTCAASSTFRAAFRSK